MINAVKIKKFLFSADELGSDPQLEFSLPQKEPATTLFFYQDPLDSLEI